MDNLIEEYLHQTIKAAQERLTKADPSNQELLLRLNNALFMIETVSELPEGENSEDRLQRIVKMLKATLANESHCDCVCRAAVRVVCALFDEQGD